MITIIDYGLGNLKAFSNIFNSHNISVKFASKAEDLESASKLILPGVGSFDYAITKLNNSGMRLKLDELVLSKKVSNFQLFFSSKCLFFLGTFG